MCRNHPFLLLKSFLSCTVAVAGDQVLAKQGGNGKTEAGKGKKSGFMAKQGARAGGQSPATLCGEL